MDDPGFVADVMASEGNEEVKALLRRLGLVVWNSPPCLPGCKCPLCVPASEMIDLGALEAEFERCQRLGRVLDAAGRQLGNQQ